jgi:hypothetical protein
VVVLPDPSAMRGTVDDRAIVPRPYVSRETQTISAVWTIVNNSGGGVSHGRVADETDG